MVLQPWANFETAHAVSSRLTTANTASQIITGVFPTAVRMHTAGTSRAPDRLSPESRTMWNQTIAILVKAASHVSAQASTQLIPRCDRTSRSDDWLAFLASALLTLGAQAGGLPC